MACRIIEAIELEFCAQRLVSPGMERRIEVVDVSDREARRQQRIKA